MSGQVTITQLPNAGPITGTESVPIVQNGQTVQTTTAAIAGAGALNYPFLTVGSTAGLSDARYLAVATGLALTDGGAGSTLQISMTGAAASLNSASTGIQVKTGPNTVTARSLAVGGGLSVSNADGVSGDPTISLGTVLANFAALTGTGILAMQSGTPAKISILGVTSQTSITNGNGSSDVTVGLASDAVLPGTSSVTVPIGTTAQRTGSPVNGMLRYNTDTATFEGYANGSWGSIAAGGGVTSVGTGTGLTGGPITSTGTISIDTTVVATLDGIQTLTNKTINGPDNTLTNIANASLANSAVTINGTSVSLGGSITVTATASQALTIGTGLSGTSYNGSTAVTIAIANTGVTANTYGSASAVPVFAVNAQGQITSVTSTNISIASSAITDKGIAGGVASLDGSGTVPTSQLPAAVLGALNYQGTWNASTNTPTLASGVGTKGYYYVVNVAGTTNLDGITDWIVGDWAVFNGTVWQKVDNTDAVTSVNGYTGTVVLSYSDVGAPSTSGTNATGTWNIGISGNAATATTATNATNVGITADSTNATRYLTFVSATTGNVPELVNSSITCNPSTGSLTGGIAGGAF
jgi:hypothetical protein